MFPEIEVRNNCQEEVFLYMATKKCLAVPETLEGVLKGLHILFEEDHINVEEVISFLESYRSNPVDWLKYANYDPYRFVYTWIL